MERKEIQFDVEKRIQAENQRSRIETAARKQDEPVDDGKLVEAMFDFLPDQSSDQQSTGRGGNNNVFMVILIHCKNCLQAKILNSHFVGPSNCKCRRFNTHRRRSDATRPASQ